VDGWASLVAQLVKNPPAMWETWVQSLNWEDPLEKENTHSILLNVSEHRDDDWLDYNKHSFLETQNLMI